MGVKSFKHKGLEKLFVDGDGSKLQPKMVEKIRSILIVIDTLEKVPEDLKRLRHLEPHKLKGKLSDYWAISVSGNYRIIFKFDSDTKTVSHLDLIDYH